MLLDIKKLTKGYQRGGKTFKAVDNANLSISSRDFVSIVGRSGSGKSTLLNMIAGLVRATSGSIEMEGRNILTLDDREASVYRNSKIGFIPQGESILANLTVLDNVRLPFYFF